MHSLLLLLLICGISIVSYSQEACISGDSDKRNLLYQLSEAKKKSPLTQFIFDKYNLDKSKTEGQFCVGCSTKLLTMDVPKFEFIRVPRAPDLIYKAECLKESNRFVSATTQVTCPDGEKKQQSLCVTESFLKYQNAILSNYYGCLISENIDTLDMHALFNLYSLETGFKSQYYYSGGVGIGQLTSILVDDIHQKERGQKYLKSIVSSKKPECDGAKIIAQKDLENKPKISQPCSFVSVGEGMERNILYSLLSFATSWEKDIEPKLRQYFQKHPAESYTQELRNLCLTNAYGPGGRAHTRALISRLSKFPPQEFVKQMRTLQKLKDGTKLNSYITNIETRKIEMAKALPEPLKSDFYQKGAKACVNSF